MFTYKRKITFLLIFFKFKKDEYIILKFGAYLHFFFNLRILMK